VIGLSVVALICLTIAIIDAFYANSLDKDYKASTKPKSDTVFNSSVSALKYNALIIGLLGLGLAGVAASTKLK